jgi:hypothetical protein
MIDVLSGRSRRMLKKDAATKDRISSTSFNRDGIEQSPGGEVRASAPSRLYTDKPRS